MTRLIIPIAVVLVIAGCANQNFQKLTVNDHTILYSVLHLPQGLIEATIGGGSTAILPNTSEEKQNHAIAAEIIAKKVCGKNLHYKIDTYRSREGAGRNAWSKSVFHCVSPPKKKDGGSPAA